MRRLLWWSGCLCIIIGLGSPFVLLSPWISDHLAKRYYQWICRILGLWSLRFFSVDNPECLIEASSNRYIITANHQAYYDIPLLAGILAHQNHYGRFVLKKELLYLPIIRSFIKRMKMLPIDRQAPRHVHQAIQGTEPCSMLPHWILFPEGTRAPWGKRLPAKNAAFVWMMQKYPTAIWIDFTINYQTWHLNVRKILTPDRSHATLSRMLDECWEQKNLPKADDA